MLNDLMLLSGTDIPFLGAQVLIHQPTIKEISLIGEESFYSGCGSLNFSKNNLSLEDRNVLINYSDFEVLMSMINSSDFQARENKVNGMMVLTLLFPDYQIIFNNQEIELRKEDECHLINSENFEEFKKILRAMFCLEGRDGDQQNYNPSGQKAQEIIDKLNKRKQKIAEQNNENNQKISVLGRLASIVATGQKQNLNEILDYTVYQLFDQFDRLTLKDQFDIHLKAQMAGARDLGEIEDWRKELHP